MWADGWPSGDGRAAVDSKLIRLVACSDCGRGLRVLTTGGVALRGIGFERGVRVMATGAGSNVSIAAIMVRADGANVGGGGGKTAPTAGGGL